MAASRLRSKEKERKKIEKNSAGSQKKIKKEEKKKTAGEHLLKTGPGVPLPIKGRGYEKGALLPSPRVLAPAFIVIRGPRVTLVIGFTGWVGSKKHQPPVYNRVSSSYWSCPRNATLGQDLLNYKNATFLL